MRSSNSYFSELPRIRTVDAHAAGEPLRVILDGLPEIHGKTMLERRAWFQEHLDPMRRALMHEPRGHFDMYGAALTPPVSEEAELGVLFLHNDGYSTMCGHGIIALVTVLIETGRISCEENHRTIGIDTPAGLVRAEATIAANGKVTDVSFLNVPSFLLVDDLEVTIADHTLTVAVAFGGAFYAILPVDQLGLQVKPSHVPELRGIAGEIKVAVSSACRIAHPNSEDLGFLYGVIFTDAPEHSEHHSRNLCVFANAEVDRSPTGTGVSARLALHFARGEIVKDQAITIESVLGKESVFRGTVESPGTVAGCAAVIPKISGQAWITGEHQFVLDHEDRLGGGFLVDS